MTFINVEPYQMQYTNGQLQPVLSADGQLQLNDASTAFNAAQRAVDLRRQRQGDVTGSFETLVGPDELKAAIAAAQKLIRGRRAATQGWRFGTVATVIQVERPSGPA